MKSKIEEKITEFVRILGGDDSDLVRVISRPGLAYKIAKLIMAPLEIEAYKIVVDYSQTWTEMISLGKYSFVDTNGINQFIVDSRFPSKGVENEECYVYLFHPNRESEATTREILEQMKGEGLKPAPIEYLLALGAQYPEVPRDFNIVCLGSEGKYYWADGFYHYYYPFLLKSKMAKSIYLTPHDYHIRWGRSDRFLALRK